MSSVRSRIVLKDQKGEEENHYKDILYEMPFDSVSDVNGKRAKYQRIRGTVNLTLNKKSVGKNSVKILQNLSGPCSESWILSIKAKLKLHQRK
jgi:hypothetical protein